MKHSFVKTVVLVLIAGSQWGFANDRSKVLEEVIVTAQHRSESAQSTPISLFTMDAEQLEKQRVNGIANLNALVPNLAIDTFPANNQTLRLFIRGVGLTDTQITQDAAVGVYLDGVYIARSTGLAFDVADLARIEVLRGPQGALYGRNTTGGAIKLITKKANVDDFTFDQTLSAGNQNLFSSKTSVNIPFADNYAAKLAYFYEDVDGFVDNTGPGGDFGDRKSKGFRLDFRARLTEDLTLDFAYDKSTIKYYNYTAQAVTPREAGEGGLIGIIGATVSQYIDYGSNKFSKLATSVPLLPTDTDIDGYSLNAEWQLNEKTTFRSITAWRELDDKSYVDFASGSSEEFRVDFNSYVLYEDNPLVLPAVRPDLNQEQFSQEFQLLGQLNDSVDYLFGLYYFWEEATEDSFPLHHIFSASLGQSTLINVMGEKNEIKNSALAFFGQFTWTPDIIDERLHFTVGWRHSEDTRKVKRDVFDEVIVDNGVNPGGPPPGLSFSAKGDKDFNDDSFSFVTEYDWTDNFHAYGKFSEAYKSGGFNIRDPDPVEFSNGFDEEKLRSVEMGFKGELLDNMLRINGAVFYSRFDDYQFNFQIPGTIQGSRVFNIDEGEISGFEMELVVKPAAGLYLQLSYAYLDADLDDVVNPVSGDKESFTFAQAPDHTYSFVLDYSWPPTAYGRVNANVSYNFVDDREPENENLHRNSYDLINGRLALSDIEVLNGQWEVAAWVKNLADNNYVSFALDNLPQASRAVMWGDGRTYGLDVTYRYF